MGKTFGELTFQLPNATAYGIIQYSTRRCCLNPSLDSVYNELDELILVRSTDTREEDLEVLPEPAEVDMGESPLMHLPLTCTDPPLSWPDTLLIMAEG